MDISCPGKLFGGVASVYSGQRMVVQSALPAAAARHKVINLTASAGEPVTSAERMIPGVRRTSHISSLIASQEDLNSFL
jgi:hypothetical protein